MAEKKSHESPIETTTQQVSSLIDSSGSRRSSLARLTDRFKHHSKSSNKKEMELTQRRLEAVMFYEQNLTERINDTCADDKDRAKARSEKTVFDRMNQEDKEMWVADRITLKEGWGAGMYGEGVNPPGMWYK